MMHRRKDSETCEGAAAELEALQKAGAAMAERLRSMREFAEDVGAVGGMLLEEQNLFTAEDEAALSFWEESQKGK